jgi:hypothetical protein
MRFAFKRCHMATSIALQQLPRGDVSPMKPVPQARFGVSPRIAKENGAKCI